MAKYSEILMDNLKYIKQNLKLIKKYTLEMICKIIMLSKLM